MLSATNRGLVWNWVRSQQARRRREQRVEFALTMHTMHLAHHMATHEAERENQLMNLIEHLSWSPKFAMEIARLAERNGLVRQENGLLAPTESGLKRA